MPNIWYFPNTGDAYDASQSSDAIKDGDVLVGLDDQVVGFLFKAWPTAICEPSHSFHQLKEGSTPADLAKDDERDGNSPVDYVASAEVAKAELDRLQQLDPPWSAETTPIGELWPEFYSVEEN